MGEATAGCFPRRARQSCSARGGRTGSQSLAKEIRTRGGRALAVATDVTSREQVKALVERRSSLRPVDVMINNAGLMPQAPLERLKVDEWDRMIDVNIKGVLYGIAAALPHMQRQKAGHFINVSSVAGHRVGPGFAVYAATKYAVRALSEGLRQEVKPYNIRTTVISPGAVATELPDGISDTGRGGARPHLLYAGGGAGRLVRPGRRIRDEPAGGGGHQRDPVPADQAGILRSGDHVGN